MDGKCFAYSPIPTEKFCLDSALDELGMLSTRTKCGLELEEIDPQAEIKDEYPHLPSISSSASRYFVQMDPKFVTNFSVRDSLGDFELDELSDEPHARSTVYHKLKDTVAKRRKRFYRPYSEKPPCSRLWQKVWPKSAAGKRLLASSENPTVDFAEKTSSSSLLVPHQDSGRKSNPSSPVKSQSSSTSVGCSIFRSRSLDDLEISKLSLKDECRDFMCHGEIDSVSQCISKLHVS